jgi:hypothetical protein
MEGVVLIDVENHKFTDRFDMSVRIFHVSTLFRKKIHVIEPIGGVSPFRASTASLGSDIL